MSKTDHAIQWLVYASLAFKPACKCGWEGKKHLMERDAKDEYLKHLAKILALVSA